ncbi:hypothetical protein [Streptomyces orinoci]|uniref:Uncharacterized protein n=1 Tax=Streptomyces orinoci TaxID=67339 RepID=A0ABV3K1R2_STRON|nr:hypothetical protein [Streptomyces orinoci]
MERVLARADGGCRRRAVNVRMMVLAGVVTLAVALPLAAATAGPAGLSGRVKTGPGKRQDAARARQRAAVASSAGSAPRAQLGDGARQAPRDGAQCGPELDSGQGLQAQTCVLADGPDTWARTYYRNGTGGPLSAVLSLMAPGGQTLQVRCPMPAAQAPDVCETPPSATPRGHGAYAAVAEIADGQGNLLLRSGSNSPEPDED